MWVEKGNNYYESTMGDYVLIVEKNNVKSFVWSFFKKGHKIDGTSIDGIKHTTKESAKEAAEDAYIKYKTSK